MQGYANAQLHLGIKYGLGKGVKKNEINAIEWIKKAALQGKGASKNL